MAKKKKFNWNNMSIAELSKSYNDNDDEDKKIKIIRAIINKYNNEKDRNGLSVYDLYAVAKAVQEATSIYNNDEGRELENSIKNLNDDIREKLDQEYDSEIGLVKKLRMKTLHEAMLKLEKTEQTQNSYNVSKTELENAFKEEDPHLDNEAKREFKQANDSGALDDIDPKIRQAIAKFAGLDQIDGKIITEVNSVWAEILGDTDIKTNPNLYSKCTPAVVFTDEQNQPINDDETTQDLTNQLKVNAALNVAYDLIFDKEFIAKYKDVTVDSNIERKQALKTAIQEKIGDRYKRSLVLAKIATDKTEDLLNNVSFKDGDIDIDIENEAFKDIMDKINADESIELNPLTVAMDKYDLENREAKITKSLKAKKIDPNKLPLLKRFQESANKAWKALSKKDTWKKIAGKTPRIAVNVAIFGTSAALMAGTTPVIATGVAMYAGWSVINAKIMPVYDKALNNIRNTRDWKTGNFSKKMKLLFKREYYKEAKNAIKKEQDKTEKKRQNTRALEGVIVGAVAGFGGFLWGPLGTKFGRQGAMALGKTYNLLQSSRALKRSKEDYIKGKQRTLQNYKLLQKRKQENKSDKFTLAAVVLGSVLADTAFANNINTGDNTVDKDVNSPITDVNNQGVNNHTEYTEELVVENDANNITTTPVDPATLTGDDLKMYNNSLKKFGEGTLGDYYKALAIGRVTCRPEEVSDVMFVDKLARLIQLAPEEHKEAISIMVRDLECDTFEPSDREIGLVHTALNTIEYEQGTMEVVILDANGNPCVEEISRFGQYIGNEQMVELDNGKQLPLRTANVTIEIGTKVDCLDNTATITRIYNVNSIDCGCDEPEVVQEDPVEPEIIPEEVQPIQFETAYLQNNDELMLTGQTTAPQYIKVSTTHSFSHEDYNIKVTDDFLKILSEPEFSEVDKDTGETIYHFWYEDNVTTTNDQLVSGQDEFEVILSESALNNIKEGNELLSFSNPASLTTEQINALSKAEITYDPKNSDNLVDKFKVKGVDGVDVVSLPKATVIDWKQEASFELSSNQDYGWATFYDTNGNEVYIEFDNKGCAAVIDENNDPVIIDKTQRKKISGMISDMAEKQNIKLDGLDLNPPGVSGKLDNIRCSTTTVQQNILNNTGKNR